MSRIFKMTAAQIAHDAPHVARYCADTIQAASNAKKPLSAIDLHNAAVALTVKLIEIAEHQSAAGELHTDEGGIIAAEELGRLSPLLLLRGGVDDRRRARIIAHELATSLQRTHVARECYNADIVECTELDGRHIRHQIARHVEELICRETL